MVISNQNIYLRKKWEKNAINIFIHSSNTVENSLIVNFIKDIYLIYIYKYYYQNLIDNNYYRENKNCQSQIFFLEHFININSNINSGVDNEQNKIH